MKLIEKKIEISYKKKLVLLAASNFSFSREKKTLKYLFLTIKYIIYRIGKANVSNCMCKK